MKCLPNLAQLSHELKIKKNDGPMIWLDLNIKISQSCGMA